MIFYRLRFFEIADVKSGEHNVDNLLQKVTVSLAAYLELILPTIVEDWWNQAVLKSLSYQQQRRIKQQKENALTSLDLAALLRVLDQNWFQISTKQDLTSESRHFVKEMQTVRNRWAHISTKEVPLEDLYRDVDTVQRFCAVIDANEDLIEEVRLYKKKLLAKEKETSGKVSNGVEFQPGQIVSVKSDPSIRGAVNAVLPGKPENRFKIFVGSNFKTFYASQIQAEVIKDETTEVIPCEQFHAYLTALQIRYPGLSTLYSLNAARIDFIPYQFRPVLRFIRSERPRLLIADGVGVGKTIEAGLILRELQARRDIRSVLIICPRPLVTEQKWINEMKRFEERFTHLDSASLRYCINEMDLEGVWPEQYQRSIVSYSLFDEVLLYGTHPDSRRKRKKGLMNLDPPPRFDLVIVDEAHHIRNPKTYNHKAVRFFCDNAEAVIFLTATPIQLGSFDLFVLLNTLRPDLIIDQESFQHMAEPNPFINRALSLIRAQEPEWHIAANNALKQAASTSWGQTILSHNPDFIRTQSKLSDANITDDERVQLITDIETMYTFSGIINRTRRRDIGEFTIRKPETVVVEFTPSQQCLHDELLRIQAEIFSRLHENVSIKFMMTTIRRQAASCLYGLAPFLVDILNRHIDELAWEEADEIAPMPEGEAIGKIQSQIQSILERARSLDPHDPKLEALRNIIQDKQKLPNNKLIVFSSFRHTLNYLYKHLISDGIRVGLVHGDTPDEERVMLRGRFEGPREEKDSVDVMLFSEIGCEGLDYQFCDCMVNYDLPWNPMRIEQRIGRIDRNGQRSESIAIKNLITPGTIDADIYERCLVRIGVFNSALGGGEEILGEITKEIRNIAEDYTLSEEERREKLKQLSDNKIRLIQEEEELEQRQMELFGIRLPEDRMKKEIEKASSFWLSQTSIQRLVKLYLQKACGKDHEFILGERPLKTLRLAQEARSLLLQDFHKLPRQNTTTYREWENWLKGGDQHLTVTFEAECALHNPNASFIMPLHPLVRQAATKFYTQQKVITTLKVQSNLIPIGSYEFAIYQWRFHGIREDLILQPISSAEGITAQLSRLLEKAEDFTPSDPIAIDSRIWDELDAQHYKLWLEARKKHQQHTKELAEYRRESLSSSHRARIAQLGEQCRQADDEKIKKMRESQIATAEADYARHIQDLDISMERADIIAEPVAYGIIEVVGDAAYAK